MTLGQRALPGVLVGAGALALLQPAAQCAVEVSKVKQQLQGSVLSHGERSLLEDGGREKNKQTDKLRRLVGMPLNEKKVRFPPHPLFTPSFILPAVSPRNVFFLLSSSTSFSPENACKARVSLQASRGPRQTWGKQLSY